MVVGGAGGDVGETLGVGVGVGEMERGILAVFSS